MHKLLLALLCLLPFAASAAEPEVLSLSGSDMTCRLSYDVEGMSKYPTSFTCARAGQVVFEEKRLEEIAISSQYNFLTAMDFDRDGHTDLRLLTANGSGGQFYAFYVYSPEAHTLQRRPEFNKCDGALDAEMCCLGQTRAGFEHSFEERICLRDGQMVTVRSDDYTWDGKAECQITRRSERQADGSMKVVRETVHDCSRPAQP